MAKATALEVAVLALHLLLYPTGVTQERRLPYRDGGAGGPVDHGDGGAQDRRPREHEPRSRRASDSEPPDGGAQHEGPRTCEAAVDQDLRERGAHEPHAGQEPEAPAHQTQPSRDRPAHQCGELQAQVATAHPGGPGGRQAREPRVPQWAPPPVVLLHGLVDNRSVFVLLRRALGRGRHVEALNYSLLTCDLRTAARQLARHVEDVCARTGHRQVDLVGHSLGGLVARYYVQRLGGDERVRTVVTLGTPHSGTAAVPLAGLHPLVRQMRPGSPSCASSPGPPRLPYPLRQLLERPRPLDGSGRDRPPAPSGPHGDQCGGDRNRPSRAAGPPRGVGAGAGGAGRPAVHGDERRFRFRVGGVKTPPFLEHLSNVPPRLGVRSAERRPNARFRRA